MDQPTFFRHLQTIAPLELAATWDNVGALIVPLKPRPISTVLLTIDLTEAVLDESQDVAADAIVAYHPPIFAGLKRLTATDRSARVAMKALSQRLVVYSPHTALDSVAGGVNDWLLACMDTVETRPIEAAQPPASSGTGFGRYATLRTPLTLTPLTNAVKSHLSLQHVRVATASRHRHGAAIETVAVCAGAGGSVLANANADLLLTGEMRHHDVLSRVEAGCSVILTDHTNTERGYLPLLAKQLHVQSQGELQICISTSDKDPLQIV